MDTIRNSRRVGPAAGRGCPVSQERARSQEILPVLAVQARMTENRLVRGMRITSPALDVDRSDGTVRPCGRATASHRILPSQVRATPVGTLYRDRTVGCHYS